MLLIVNRNYNTLTQSDAGDIRIRSASACAKRHSDEERNLGFEEKERKAITRTSSKRIKKKNGGVSQATVGIGEKARTGYRRTTVRMREEDTRVGTFSIRLREEEKEGFRETTILRRGRR